VGASGGGAGGRDGGGGAGGGDGGVSEVTSFTAGDGGTRGAAEEGGSAPVLALRAGSGVAFLPRPDEPDSGRLGDRVADYLEEVEPGISCAKCRATRSKPSFIELDAPL
jgi:hypothetical protein